MAVAVPRTYLITGANRGIGFYLAKKLLSYNERVIATCRNPDSANELKGLEGQANLTIEGEHPHNKHTHTYSKLTLDSVLALDVSSDQSAKDLAERLKAKGTKINVLINNAGILKNYQSTVDQVSSADILEHFETNTLGPHRVTQALLPVIEGAGDKPPGKILISTSIKRCFSTSSSSLNQTVILSVSSTLGSISDNSSGKSYGW